MYVNARAGMTYEKKQENREKKPDYTFLHDWFGNTWRHLETDPKDADHDFVQVRCPAPAMESWALQYSDRVEVQDN